MAGCSAINTIDHIADDVHNSNLNILTQHTYAGECGQDYKAVILNAKGFGGNNASGLVLSPQQTVSMLTAKYGIEAMSAYSARNQAIKAVTRKMILMRVKGKKPFAISLVRRLWMRIQLP